MRFIYAGIVALLIAPVALADTNVEPLLNSVTLQLNAEQWVTTKTALVTAGVNASVNDQGLEKVQSDVLNKLNQITNKGPWHIVSFNRNLDQSGLERIQMSAQVRLSSADLGGLRDRAKAISKPGETFTIDNVEFTPSPEELRAANTTLRNDIYQQVTAELATLNKNYSDQKYYLHNLNFLGNLSPVPQPMMYAKVASAGSDNTISVGDKMRLSATVVLAAAPNEDVMKLTQHN